MTKVNFLKFGCSLMVFVFVIIVCFGIYILGLIPEQVIYPRSTVISYCNERLFAEVIYSSNNTMRVEKDLLGSSRVVGVNENNEDICFFRASTHPQAGFWSATSPDSQYTAFTSNQFVMSSLDNVVHHLFIINNETGEYVNISSIQEEFENYIWSPDSSQLIYFSRIRSLSVYDYYIGSLSPNTVSNWKVILENTAFNPSWGYFEWIDNDTRLRYGHDEDQILGKGVGVPFWCYTNADGTNLSCERVEPSN